MCYFHSEHFASHVNLATARKKLQVNVTNHLFNSNLVSLGILQQLLGKFKLQSSDETLPEKEKPEQLLENVTFEGVADYIRKGRCEY